MPDWRHGLYWTIWSQLQFNRSLDDLAQDDFYGLFLVTSPFCELIQLLNSYEILHLDQFSLLRKPLIKKNCFCCQKPTQLQLAIYCVTHRLNPLGQNELHTCYIRTTRNLVKTLFRLNINFVHFIYCVTFFSHHIPLSMFLNSILGSMFNEVNETVTASGGIFTMVSVKVRLDVDNQYYLCSSQSWLYQKDCHVSLVQRVPI